MDKPIVERFLLGNLAREEMNEEFTGDHEDDMSEGINEGLSLASGDDRLSMDCSRGDSFLAEKELEDKLKSTKAEMVEMRKENERLKMVLAQIVKEYKALQMHFVNYAKQGSTNNQQKEEKDPLVSLTLGRQAYDQQVKKIEQNIRSLTYESKQDEKFDHEGLKLRLDCRSISEPARIEPMVNPVPSHETSFEEHKENEPITDAWPLGKSLKTMRSVEDEISLHQTQLKRARVSVRARCDTPTMNDGCQWRKYGQKTAKGNPCPRAYYRCTVSPMCPVRKQVQRCAEDTSILITTYEGNHNHPLSISATSMASTTSAAATMLRSGSSTTTSNIMSASTALNTHPTITLDLTSLPKYPSTSTSNACLNFSSNSSTSSSSDYLNYGTPLYNRSMSTSNLYQPYYYMQTKSTQNGYLPMSVDQKAAFTADPRFRSVVEAAITSMINKNGDHNGGDASKFSHNMKFGH